MMHITQQASQSTEEEFITYYVFNAYNPSLALPIHVPYK